MSQRRNTSRQLRRNCKACISTACITPDGILGCSVDKRSRRPFTWSGSVIVKVDVKLDIPVTGYLCFLAQDRRHALLLRPRENVPTDAEAVNNGSGEAEERRLSPRRPSSSLGMLVTRRSGLLPGRTREQASGAHQLWWSRSDAHCHSASRAISVSCEIVPRENPSAPAWQSFHEGRV
jgi:hypothetical protein